MRKVIISLLFLFYSHQTLWQLSILNTELILRTQLRKVIISLLQSPSTLAIKYDTTDNRDNSKAWNAARMDEILWSACLQLRYDLRHACAFICPEDFTC